MKAKLTFNLPEEQYGFDTACRAADWREVVSELDRSLRDAIKYGSEKFGSRPADALQRVRDFIHQELITRNLSLD